MLFVYFVKIKSSFEANFRLHRPSRHSWKKKKEPDMGFVAHRILSQIWDFYMLSIMGDRKRGQ